MVLTTKKRVFILGAGFSRPAGMPLSTEMLPLLLDELGYDDPDMSEWIAGLQERLAWLSGAIETTDEFKLNVEEVFHYAHFDIEQFRLKQHLEQVGRYDGAGTAWNLAENVAAWLSYLEDTLRDVILAHQIKADLSAIRRWARAVGPSDTVLTFNYDTLVERAFEAECRTWNHGTARGTDTGISVCKLHGSIDWIVAARRIHCKALDLLYEKPNLNRSEHHELTGHFEDDYRLWRCRSQEQLTQWLADRDLQKVPEGAVPSSVGMAGLGAYKQLHQIPGLGQVWTKGMRALYESDSAIVIGFSMSDFDAMAQMQFADVARSRDLENRPLPVTVIDVQPNASLRTRFERVFRHVEFVESSHERIDWARFGRS